MTEANSKNKENKLKDKKSRVSRPNDFYKYTGMAIKMGVVILIGVLSGRKLDETMANSTPWATILLSLIGVGAAIYFVISDTSR